MAFLVRAISKPKWVRPDWLPLGDAPGDALSDLRTTNNALSVWMLDDGRLNLPRILEALASNRERLDKLDYTIIDEQAVRSIPVTIEEADGDTPHATANTIHRDLTELSAFKLTLLASEMVPLERFRLTQRQVTNLLLTALQEGRLDRGRLRETLLAELTPPVDQPPAA